MLQTDQVPGLTIYAVLLTAAGQYLNGATPETYNAAHWASYAIACTDAGGIGHYFASEPGSLVAGLYREVYYMQAGSAPAVGDLCVDAGWLQWDGATRILPSQAGDAMALTMSERSNVAAAVWLNSTRTLSSSGTVVVLSPIDGDNITLQVGDKIALPFENVGSLTTADDVYFAVKTKATDSDARALLCVSLNAGLLYIAAGVAANPLWASATIIDAVTGDITFTIEPEATLLLAPYTDAEWSIKRIDATNGTQTLISGTATIHQNVVHAIDEATVTYQIYYIDTVDGDDGNPGTRAEPFKSNAGLPTLVEGDIVVVVQ